MRISAGTPRMIDRGGVSPEDRGPGAAKSPTPRKRRDVTGILVLDKPSGMTSNRALQRVRGIYRARKAGHTGSLDPLASGVLPICLGEATKVSGLLLDSRKCYDVVARLGTRTDTGDADGEVVETRGYSHVDMARVEHVLARFTGDIEQVPPMYSALKYQGKRLYSLARQGKTVDRPPRPVTIYALQALGLEGPDLALRVCCSKGTYVRTLVEDIGGALGTVAHVTGLRRIAAGALDQSSMVTMAMLEAAADRGDYALDALLQAPDAVLPDLPEVVLDEDGAGRITCGQQIESPIAEAGPVRVYGPERAFLGLGEVLEDGRLAPRRLFQTEVPRRRAAESGEPGRKT
jgi:tRNA pseudouridine55 synthase